RVRIEPPPEKLMDVGDLGEALVRSHGHQMQERMGVVLVDARHRVMKQKEIFIGSLKETLVSTRDIIRYALLEHAAGIVVFHNHPSGDPTPSNDDITFTQQLAHSMMLVDVEFVDHLIIAAHRYCSMKQAGLVQPATRTGLGAVTSRSA
ncbi:MAG TPA: JAB domain-containing protein, partial [Thermoanaerobaculia bacterium]|nr:JAB domain-containing protein [Thermoanaerobaculia bacterium]